MFFGENAIMKFFYVNMLNAIALVGVINAASVNNANCADSAILINNITSVQYPKLSVGEKLCYREEVESKSITGRVKKFIQTVTWEVLQSPTIEDKIFHYYLFGNVKGVMSSPDSLLGDINYEYPIFLAVSDRSCLHLLYHPWEPRSSDVYTSISSSSILHNTELRELQALELVREFSWIPVYDVTPKGLLPAYFCRGTRIDENIGEDLADFISFFEKSFVPVIEVNKDSFHVRYRYQDGFNNYASQSYLACKIARNKDAPINASWNLMHIVNTEWGDKAELQLYDFPGISRDPYDPAFGQGSITYDKDSGVVNSMQGALYKFRTTFAWDKKGSMSAFMNTDENAYEYVKININRVSSSVLYPEVEFSSSSEIEEKIERLEKETSSIVTEYDEKRENRSEVLQEMLLLLYEHKDKVQGDFLELSNLLSDYKKQKDTKESNLLQERKKEMSLQISKLKLMLEGMKNR